MARSDLSNPSQHLHRPPQSIEFVVKPRENLSLVGTKRTIARVTANDPYPCQMQKNQAFSCLFRHYAKHNGLRKEDLVFSFVDELKPDETPETVHLMPNDEIWVERRSHEPEEEKPEPVTTAPFSDQFRTLLENPVHSDITFLVGEGSDKNEVLAHKAILSARSEYFSAMFKPGGMSESKKDTIEIHGHSSSTFRQMVEFVYTNTVRDLENVDSTELISLLMLANEYLLEDLRRLCEITAEGCLDKSNIGTMIDLSAKHNAADLRRACRKFIQDHNEELRQDADFREEIRTNPELALIFFDAHTDSSQSSTGARKRKRITNDAGSSSGLAHSVPSAAGDNPNTIFLLGNNDQA